MLVGEYADYAAVNHLGIIVCQVCGEYEICTSGKHVTGRAGLDVFQVKAYPYGTVHTDKVVVE